MKHFLKLTLIFTLMAQTSSLALEIKTDSHFSVNESHPLWDSYVNRAFPSKLQFNFQTTEEPLIFSLSNISSTDSTNETSTFNINGHFLLNLDTGELSKEGKVIAYYCGDERHHETSLKPVDLQNAPRNSDGTIDFKTVYSSFPYSIACKKDNKTGFVLDNKAEIQISNNSKIIQFTPNTDAQKVE